MGYSRGHEIYNIGKPFLAHNNYKTNLSDLCLKVVRRFLKNSYCIFTIWPIRPCPCTRTQCPRGHEIYNFDNLFIVYHIFILSLSDLCPGLENKIFNEIVHFHYIIQYDHTLAQEYLLCGSCKFTILVNPSLVNHFYILNWSDLSPGVEKRFMCWWKNLCVRQGSTLTLVCLSGTSEKNSQTSKYWQYFPDWTNDFLVT